MKDAPFKVFPLHVDQAVSPSAVSPSVGNANASNCERIGRCPRNYPLFSYIPVVEIPVGRFHSTYAASRKIIEKRSDFDFERRHRRREFRLFDDFDFDPRVGEQRRSAVVECTDF